MKRDDIGKWAPETLAAQTLFGSDPVNLMFAVHGHIRRMLRAGKAAIVAAGERPPRYRLP